MALRRLPIRDPRTVARDVLAVLDVLFPRLSGALVASLNRKMFAFEDIKPIPEDLIEQSKVHKSLLFELSMVRAESLLSGDPTPSTDACLKLAFDRQSQHFDVRFPDELQPCDLEISRIGSHNLYTMLRSIQAQNPLIELEKRPIIPGLGWIGSGTGDFSLGPILIEVKHTDRNFIAGDFRQVLMYWLLKYSHAIEIGSDIWTDVLLLNPRRNAGLLVRFDYLLRSASANSGRVELFELLRSMVGQE